MRIRGRFSNPLLRRVQRHTRVSTLFHVGSAELQPAEPVGGQALARPVTAFLPSAEVEPVPFRSPAPLTPSQAVPAAPPVQTYPAAPTPPPASLVRTPQAPPPAASSPVAQPAGSALSVAVPQPDAMKVDEDRNWKRLQTILRKHAEKEEPLQGQTEVQAPAAASQPSFAAQAEPSAKQPSIAQIKVPDKPTEIPISAPVQRRASLVEELPAAPVERPPAGSLPPAHESKTQPPPVPPLKEFVKPEEAASTAPSQPASAPAGLPNLPAKRIPGDTPILAEKRPSSAPPLQAKAETAVGPKESAAQPPAPFQPQQASPAVSASGQVEKPPQPEPPAAEAPTIQVPRASLKPDLPGESAEKPLIEKPAAAEGSFTSQALPEGESRPDKIPAVEPPPIPSAPRQAPTVPVIKREPDQVLSQFASPPVKASLPGPVQLRSAPEPAGAPVQAVPLTQSVSPPAPPPIGQPIGEPLPGYVVPPAAPEEVTAAAPLESIWPVQRLPAAEPRAVPVGPSTPDAAPAVLPHDEQLGQMLQSVAPGLPSDSSVELVTPRKPRPPVAAKPTAPPLQPERPPSKPPAELNQPPSEPLKSTGSVLHAAAPGEVAASLPEVQPVPTEIGPLPSDLWGLIGQPVPGETPSLPEKSVPAHTERRSALQRHVEEKTPVQRSVEHPETGMAEPSLETVPAQSPQPRPPKAEAEAAEAYPDAQVLSTDVLEPEVPEDVIQRAVMVDEVVGEIEGPVEEEQPVDSSPNVEELAQRVYREIRRRLSVEFERWRRGG